MYTFSQDEWIQTCIAIYIILLLRLLLINYPYNTVCTTDMCSVKIIMTVVFLLLWGERVGKSLSS